MRVESVKFADLGKAASMNAITRRLRGSEHSTFIRAHFLAENPSDEEWAVTFTVEFLDKSSAVIDRVTKRSTWEGSPIGPMRHCRIWPLRFEHLVIATFGMPNGPMTMAQ